jgi:hypothetical protein
MPLKPTAYISDIFGLFSSQSTQSRYEIADDPVKLAYEYHLNKIAEIINTLNIGLKAGPVKDTLPGRGIAITPANERVSGLYLHYEINEDGSALKAGAKEIICDNLIEGTQTRLPLSTNNPDGTHAHVKKIIENWLSLYSEEIEFKTDL